MPGSLDMALVLTAGRGMHCSYLRKRELRKDTGSTVPAPMDGYSPVRGDVHRKCTW